jgi:hypothetical protein
VPIDHPEEAPCARCLFGSRVVDDEIHTALALER